MKNSLLVMHWMTWFFTAIVVSGCMSMAKGTQESSVAPSNYAAVPCERLASNIAQAQGDAARIADEADSALQKDMNIGVWLGPGVLNLTRGKSWFADWPSRGDVTDSPAMHHLTRAKAESLAMVKEYNARCRQAGTPPMPDVRYPPSRWDRDRAAQPTG